MTIYIASALPNLATAREWADALRGAGHEVTSTWHDSAASTVERESTLSCAEQGALAELCLDQVHRAAVLVWLHGNAHGRVGAAIEVGAALSDRSTMVWMHSLDGSTPPSIFSALCDSVASLSELLGWLA